MSDDNPIKEVYTVEDFSLMLDYRLLAWWIFAHEDNQESNPDSLTQWIENFYTYGRTGVIKMLANMKISK